MLIESLILPEPTLSRALADDDDPKQTIINQVSIQTKLFSVHSPVTAVLRNIKRLAAMLGGRQEALNWLVLLGIEVWHTVLCYNHGLDEDVHAGTEEADKVDALLCERLKLEITFAASLDRDWYEGVLLEQIEDGWSKLNADWYVLPDQHEHDDYFRQSLLLLHKRHSRRVANFAGEPGRWRLLPSGIGRDGKGWHPMPRPGSGQYVREMQKMRTSRIKSRLTWNCSSFPCREHRAAPCHARGTHLLG